MVKHQQLLGTLTMSDIALNASRYDIDKVKRSDPPNPHNGENVNGGIGFDCSGFVCHVIIESGYRINYEGTSTLITSKAFTTIPESSVQPGDIILFRGHVGIVMGYTHKIGLGRFIHMSGENNKGRIKTSFFITDCGRYRHASGESDDSPLKDPAGESIRYGVSRPIKAFRRVNGNRYSIAADLHIDGSKPHPILRSLGTRVYSETRLRTTKAQTKIVETRQSLPSPNPLKPQPVPDWVGYSAVLLKKAWGKLTEGDLVDYE